MFKKIHESLFRPSVTEDRVDAFCFNFILFDIFFVPLFPWFSVSISLPVMIWWYLQRKRLTNFEPERKYFSVVVLLMAISTLFSLFDFNGASYNTDFITSFKRCVQYITSFWFYFFFVYFFVRYNRKVTNIVFWGVVYIFLYALLFSFDQNTFVNLKSIICPFDPQVERWRNDTLLTYRFNYLWADPNNVAYAITALSIFYFVEEKKSTLKKYLVLACLAYVLLCTMSLGGIGVASVLVVYLLVFTNLFRSSQSAIFVSLTAIIFFSGYVVLNMDFFQDLINTGIVQRQNVYGNVGLSGGGGRVADLFNGLNKFNPLFLIVGSGKEGYVTEIGHIYVWYMYGLPVYIFFLYVLFGKRKCQTFVEYFSIIPLFVGFTMNVAIGEQKYCLLTLLISAYYSAKYYRLKRISLS